MKPVVAIYSTFLQRALRPADPRRRAAEPAGRVRDRPRRRRRRRRRDAHRRVRPRVPALPAQHDGDGAVRRERVPADALHGDHARHAGRRALSARQRARASRSRPRCARCRSARARSAARRQARTQRIAILAFGSMLQPALAAARGARRDGRQHALREAARRRARRCALARDHDALVTIEEDVVAGGAGSAVAEALAAAGRRPCRSCISGLPDAFIDHGDPAFLLAHVGLDAKGIAASVRARFDARGKEPRGRSRRLDIQGIRYNHSGHEPPRATRPPDADPRRAVADRTSAISRSTRSASAACGIRSRSPTADGAAQPTIATANVYVALAEDRKGTHMSRLVMLLEERAAPGARAAVGGAASTRCCYDLVARLDAPARPHRARVPVLRAQDRAGVGRREPARLRSAGSPASWRDGRITKTIAVAVPVTSLCPCSKEIADYGAHNQRSTVTITVRTQRDGRARPSSCASPRRRRRASSTAY